MLFDPRYSKNFLRLSVPIWLSASYRGVAKIAYIHAFSGGRPSTLKIVKLMLHSTRNIAPRFEVPAIPMPIILRAVASTIAAYKSRCHMSDGNAGCYR